MSAGSSLAGSDYVFATAIPNDASQMKKLNEACLPENYPYRFWFDMVSMNPGRCFICRSVKDRKMVGYALFCEDSKRRMRLMSVAVLPTYRGKGVAAELLRRGLVAIGTRPCELEVRTSNEGAIRLYERLGFRKLRIFPGYYADNEDAWVMVRAVETPDAVTTIEAPGDGAVSASPTLPPVA
jgi:ribosomal-protein-alanine N-acetyltransferase